jgi:hypothetical protein
VCLGDRSSQQRPHPGFAVASIMTLSQRFIDLATRVQLAARDIQLCEMTVPGRLYGPSTEIKPGGDCPMSDRFTAIAHRPRTG